MHRPCSYPALDVNSKHKCRQRILPVPRSGFLLEFPMNRKTTKSPRLSVPIVLALLFVFFALLPVEPASGQQRTGRIPGGPTSSRDDPDSIYTGPAETSAPLKAEATVVPVRVVVRDA